MKRPPHLKASSHSSALLESGCGSIVDNRATRLSRVFLAAELGYVPAEGTSSVAARSPSVPAFRVNSGLLVRC